MQGGTPLEPLFGFSQAKFDVTKFNWLISLNRFGKHRGVLAHLAGRALLDDLYARDVVVGSSGGGDLSTKILPRLLNQASPARVQDHLGLQRHR